MHHSLTGIFIFLFTFTMISLPEAQIRLSDDQTVDSLTFYKTRSLISLLPDSAFEKRIYSQGTKQLPYRLLFPKNFNINKKYPIILTFHNSSRIGIDNEKQLEHLAKIWIREEIYSRYNAFVIVPQFNERSSLYHKNGTGLMTSTPYPDIQLVINLLNDFGKKYKVDVSRIYLVGYSMGASTVQNLINLNPDRFAAAVSIAAVPDLTHPDRWKNKSLLLIHGKMDTDNPYSGSVALFNALKDNKRLIFKTYNNLNHNNITIPFLLSDEIPEWLFRQKKRQ